MDYQTGESRRHGAAAGLLPRLAAGICLAFLFGISASTPAFALSEIKREELPAPTSPAPSDEGLGNTVPFPDLVQPPSADQPIDPEKTGPAGEETPEGVEQPDAEAAGPLPEVIYDLERLPPDVKRMRELLIEAAKSGDIERLRPLIGLGDDMAQLSLAGIEGDPIEHLKSLSGDAEGREILAILEEVLSAGYVHLDAGGAEELYVWPYFFAIPLDRLDARQHVELFKIVTAGDYEDMKNFGSYIFYRLGITPDGRWAFFVAGE
ncbi:hypothetical protein [Allomesorhizobium alhagi]|uniref:Uncharacterized protein n=1 Tax=Mesorhizobium alhagi CCNWXJ12-2 TaxID=1107882 RepID=H0HQN3_9HYPH|nr:hypothetical protein [Mesorhizobium alhagi]EHK56948.1 hypothetical protein MAXJ12_12317 [Mesorhizobium alhagi CCNWXJ12-2]